MGSQVQTETVCRKLKMKPWACEQRVNTDVAETKK